MEQALVTSEETFNPAAGAALSPPPSFLPPSLSSSPLSVQERAAQRGYVQTLIGRRRPLPGIVGGDFNSREAAQRKAINTTIQGSAADVIKESWRDGREDGGMEKRGGG